MVAGGSYHDVTRYSNNGLAGFGSKSFVTFEGVTRISGLLRSSCAVAGPCCGSGGSAFPGAANSTESHLSLSIFAVIWWVAKSYLPSTPIISNPGGCWLELHCVGVKRNCPVLRSYGPVNLYAAASLLVRDRR